MRHTALFTLSFALCITALACSSEPDAPASDTSSPLDMADAALDMPSHQEDMPRDLSLEDSASDLSVPDMTVQDMLDMHDMETPEDLGSDLTDLEDMPDMQEPLDMPDMPMSGMPLAGFGMLSGDCQQIDTELMDPGPSAFRNTLDFGMDPYGMEDLMMLTAGGQTIVAAGNAGGSSLISEVFAFEVLARCESAVLLETEKTIDYFNEMGKITDLLVEIDGERVGVSVVRAFAFPFEDPYPESEARRILEKKLGDILLSTQNVRPNHAWVKQILSVIAYTPQHADQIEAVYQTLDASIKSDTILYITATHGEDGPLYFND